MQPMCHNRGGHWPGAQRRGAAFQNWRMHNMRQKPDTDPDEEDDRDDDETQ